MAQETMQAVKMCIRDSCMDAALQYTLSPQELSARMFQVEAGQERKIEELLAALVRCGYVREDQIEAPGQFSHRGGIVDFFSPGGQSPVRVEFWGDEVDSVSCFDLDSQRRTDPVDAVTPVSYTHLDVYKRQIIDMWGVFVPLGFLAAFVFQLPPMAVYCILSLDEFAKMPVVYHRYRQKKWLRNITRDVA